MRSRSISPSTSIRSHSSDNSNSDDSCDDTSRYAGLTEEELNEIWERRNLAYFDRRQQLLAEERERQQQGMGGDEAAAHNGSDTSSHSSASVEEQLGAGFASSARQQRVQQQQITRPAGFICAAEDPQWREMTSRNIMGEYDPHRASRDPAYQNAWMSCQRIVNMNRSGAAAGNFIPTNPRLATLLEHRRLEMARERYEEAATRWQQRVMVEGSVSQENHSFALSAGVPTVLQQQQAAEYDRLNQAQRLQQRDSDAHAHGNSSLKSSSSESNAGEKRFQPINQASYYLALPHPTQQLTKYVSCAQCNCTLYTNPLAKRFFCQTCGCVSTVRQGAVDSFEEKMQDAEDHDCQMSY
ncbi:hypothetical protein ACHAXM_003254 [Skeletonema potamos]